ncbi:MAG: TonB-dependent receptor domain-containing protein, partial [Bacteroidia bacterium]
MNFIKTCSVLLVLALWSISAEAQRGSVTGKVIDAGTSETLTSVVITCPTSSGGGFSDFEGKFTASFEAGTRDISFKLMGYDELILKSIVVPADGSVHVGDIKLKTKAEDAVKGGVTIRVKGSTKSETALIKQKQKSVKFMDGTSKQAISKVGDGDAAAATSRVTGVSVEGGKYVYVRGLGDRYTKTVLNGMELPGLDPDRNTVQMDIFPTNLIDNIVVLKSFTPDLSGDFTGGWVDVQTTDFQAKEVFGASISLGYNPAMSLNGDFLSHGGNVGDAFAFGRGSRAIPFGEAKEIASSEYTQSNGGAQRAEDNMNAFNKELSAAPKTSLLNSSFSINYGNQINKKDETYGYNLALGYSNSYKYYENAIFQSFIKDQDKSVYELVFAEENNGRIGENEVLWSALANGSMKEGLNSLSTTLLHTQNGVKKSSINTYRNKANPFGDAGAQYDKNVLYYNQRTLTSLLVEHTHKNDTGWSFTTKVSPSFSTNNEPDIRITTLSFDENDRYTFNTGAGSGITRLFRSLTELNLNAKWDAEKTYKLNKKRETKLKFGLANNLKNRAFSVFEYLYNRPIGTVSLTGDPNQISDEYLFDAETGQGFTIYGQPQESNAFNATMNVAGVYAMNEYPISSRLVAVYGVRVEKADMYYTGQNTSGLAVQNEKVLNEFNVLPSVNFVFRASSKVNIRVAGTRTLARPSFKEKSLAEIVDPISGRTFIGNLDLEQTEVTNFDLRLEKFMKPGELISISGFFKNFVNPIEVVVYKP